MISMIIFSVVVESRAEFGRSNVVLWIDSHSLSSQSVQFHPKIITTVLSNLEAHAILVAIIVPSIN